MTTKLSSLSLRYIRVKEKHKQGTFMIGIIMVKEIIKYRYRTNSGDRRITFSGRIHYG